MEHPAQQNLNQLAVGTVLGDFRISGVVGEGGFGIVYLAYESALDRTVAIKEYLPSSIAGRTGDQSVHVRSQLNADAFASGLRNFLREAQMLARFSHPAMVEVHRVWEQNGTAYMAMRYYAGRTLREARLADGEIDEASMRRVLEPVLDALTLLHAQNVIHRDVSPDNILIRDNGAPVLLDLGAARLVVGGMTQALTTVLKPGYAPIEQYVDDGTMQQGPWTDVYGLGAVLYYLLLGAAPPQAVARMITDPMRDLASRVQASFPAHLVEATIKALAVHPEQRFQSVDALREALGWTEAAPLETRFVGGSEGGAGRVDATAVRPTTGGGAPRAASVAPPPRSQPATPPPIPPPATAIEADPNATIVWKTGDQSAASARPRTLPPASPAKPTTAPSTPWAAASAAPSVGPSAARSASPSATAPARPTAAKPAATPSAGLARPQRGSDYESSAGGGAARWIAAFVVAAAVAGGGYYLLGHSGKRPGADAPAVASAPTAPPGVPAPDVPGVGVTTPEPSAAALAAQAKLDNERRAREKAEQEQAAKAQRDADAAAKAEAARLAKEAKLKAEADARAEAQAKAKADSERIAKARAEADERARRQRQDEDARAAAARAKQDTTGHGTPSPVPPPATSTVTGSGAPRRIEDLSAQAMAAFRRGDLAGARALWSEITSHAQASGTDKARAYNNMAISYCNNGDEIACERMYTAMLRSDRNYSVSAGEREGDKYKRAFDRAWRTVRGGD
ncbi:MAG: protein kinase [Proteobacteria bacterium]|nr:protein kinase [Pseudomonadota bacterium]